MLVFGVAMRGGSRFDNRFEFVPELAVNTFEKVPVR